MLIIEPENFENATYNIPVECNIFDIDFIQLSLVGCVIQSMITYSVMDSEM